MYSCLAGSVEPREDLEGAVGPWPFPHSLMVGFRADFVSGTVVCEESEIRDANWYRRDNMPTIPPETTIAGKMIRAWLGGA
jgi:NAD+ diphosphatase